MLPTSFLVKVEMDLSHASIPRERVPGGLPSVRSITEVLLIVTDLAELNVNGAGTDVCALLTGRNLEFSI